MQRGKTMLIVLLTALCTYLALRLDQAEGKSKQAPAFCRDTVTVVRIDTIIAHSPVPKDSAVVRYVKIPAKTQIGKPIGEGPAQKAQISLGSTDSVEIPITSKHYADTLYDAWVSGYEPSLDSIKVYSHATTLTITETIIHQPRRKRWHLGPSAGLGIAPDGRVRPYIGLAVTYALWDI